jgi:hypothetical protein
MQQSSLVFACQNLRDPEALSGSSMRRRRRGGAAAPGRSNRRGDELGREATPGVTACTSRGPCESGFTARVVDERPGATYEGRMHEATADAHARRQRLPRHDLLDLFVRREDLGATSTAEENKP